MAVRPTPVGQRIQPRFARGEERNKITVQKIVKLLRCIVRQQDARALLVGRHPKQRVLPADLGDEVVPNPTMALALKQRMSDRFLDTLGAASALHVRRPTFPPRNHAVLTRRQLVCAKTQLCLEHPSMTQTNGAFTCQILRQSDSVRINDLLKFPQRALLTQIILERPILTCLDVFFRGILRRGLLETSP